MADILSTIRARAALKSFLRVPILVLASFRASRGIRPGIHPHRRHGGILGVATPAAIADSKQSYVLDKLHSLSGVIPIGVFLLEHFFENSYALVSPDKYNYVAGKLETIPWRVPVELLGIWLPILFHALYGIYIWWKGKSNVFGHPWMSNWMYTLQRWSGIIAFFYICWHVWTQRFLTHGHTTYAAVAQDLSNPYSVLFYVVGIVAASFHLGNGLWNFACKWGIAISPGAQRRAAIFGAMVGIVFTVVGLTIIAGFHYHWMPFNTYVQ
jgi:succinate dehydrogenase / fumarate reductase cytochrome b subunit